MYAHCVAPIHSVLYLPLSYPQHHPAPDADSAPRFGPRQRRRVRSQSRGSGLETGRKGLLRIRLCGEGQRWLHLKEKTVCRQEHRSESPFWARRLLRVEVHRTREVRLVHPQPYDNIRTGLSMFTVCLTSLVQSSCATPATDLFGVTWYRGEASGMNQN